MTQDSQELPEEIGQALDRLGRVAPPDPAVLDATREILWAAVAAEMLPSDPGGTGSRRGGEHDRVAERKTDRPDP